MSVLGVPVKSKNSFAQTQHAIGEWRRLQLAEVMTAARKEEKRLAEEIGDYYEGVSAITVVVDGGWSKRFHKHSYNAKSGVGVIWERGQESCCVLVFATNAVLPLLRAFHKRIMFASIPGASLHHR